MKKFLIAFLLISCLFSSAATHAEEPVPLSANTKAEITSSDIYKPLAPLTSSQAQGVKSTGIGDYFNTMFKLAIALCAGLAVIMIVIGGVQYMGDESVFGKTEAKSKIMQAILGLFIALGSYAILNTIDPALLGKGGVNVDQVGVEIININDPSYQHNETGGSHSPRASVSTWPNQSWHDTALAAVRTSKLPTQNPTDATVWFGVAKVSDEKWVGLLAGMAKAESDFTPTETYTEKFKDTKGNFVVSTGLFQISQESAKIYGLSDATTEKLKDPIYNIKAAVKILEWWVVKDHVVATTGGTPKHKGGARYWSVLRSR